MDGIKPRKKREWEGSEIARIYKPWINSDLFRVSGNLHTFLWNVEKLNWNSKPCSIANRKQSAFGSELGFPGSSWLFEGFWKEEESNKRKKDLSIAVNRHRIITREQDQWLKTWVSGFALASTAVVTLKKPLPFSGLQFFLTADDFCGAFKFHKDIFNYHRIMTVVFSLVLLFFSQSHKQLREWVQETGLLLNTPISPEGKTTQTFG